MSTIDNRIVKMSFDNAQFERGAAQSMSTLDKLKKKLTFRDTEKNLSSLQKSIDSVKFDKLLAGVENLQKRFSAAGIASMEVVKRLTNYVIDGLAKIEDATLGQIKRGGWTRAMNLANAQFQIEGLGYSWEKVLEAVNYGVLDTAYGLDAAASAASQLAASGVDFTKVLYKVGDTGITQMHKALRGISGVAAMTNSTYEEIAQIFTRVAGQGRVMGNDLNSIAARGLNATAELAKYLKTTEANIKDMVRVGEIDFDTFATAMDSAFGAHAKEANKTFQGAMSNMKAALSRIGAIFAQPVVDKSNNLFNALTKKINAVKGYLADTTVTTNGVTRTIKRFQGHFTEAYEKMIDAAVKFIEKMDMSWFKNIADILDNLAQKFSTFAGSFVNVLGNIKTAIDSAKNDITVGLGDAMAAFEIFFNGKYGNGKARVKALTQAGKDAKQVQALINDWYKAGFDPAKMTMKITDTSAADLAEWLKEVHKNGYKLNDTVKKLGTSTTQLSEEVQEEVVEELRRTATYDNLGKTILHLRDIITGSVSVAWNTLKGLFGSVKQYFDPYKFSSSIEKVTGTLSNAVGEVKKYFDFDAVENYQKRINDLGNQYKAGKITIAEYRSELDKVAESVNKTRKTKKIFDEIAKSLNDAKTVAVNLAKAAVLVGKAIVKGFLNVFKPEKAAKGIGDLTGSLATFSEKVVILAEKAFPVVEGAATTFFAFWSAKIQLIKKAVTWVADLASGLIGTRDATQSAMNAGKKAPTLFDRIGNFGKKLGAVLENLPDKISELYDKLNQNKGIQRFKEAIGGLWKMLKEFLGIASETGEELAEKFLNKDTGASIIDKLIEGVGWLADKLAIILETLPKAAESIGSFFGSVTTAITGFFTDSNKASDDFVRNNAVAGAITRTTEMIGDATDPEKSVGIFESLKNFFTAIGNAIKEGFAAVNWDNIKSFALIGATVYSMVKLGKIADSVETVPKSISKFFSGIGSMFKNYGYAIAQEAKWSGIVKFVQSLTYAFITLAGLIAALGMMDRTILEQGIAGLTIMTGLIVIIVKIMTKLNAAKPDRIDNSVTIGKLTVMQDSMLGLGVFFAGLALTLMSFVKVMEAYDKLKDADGALGAVIGILLVFTSVVVILIGIIGHLSDKLGPLRSSKLYEGKVSSSLTGDSIKESKGAGFITENEKNPLIGALLSLAALMVSLAGSVVLIALAATLLDKTKVGYEGVGKISLIVLAIAGATAIIAKCVKGVDLKSLLGAALLVISFAAMIKIICGSLLILGAEFAVISKLGGNEGLMMAIDGLFIIIVGIGLAIAAMAWQFSKMGNVKASSLPLTLLAMAAIIGVIGFVVAKLATISGVDMGPLMLTTAIIIASMGLLYKIFETVAGHKDLDAQRLLGIAAAIAAVGASVALIGVGFMLMANVSWGKLLLGTIAVAGIIGMFILMGKLLDESKINVLTGFVVSFGATLLMAGVGAHLFASGLDKILPKMPAMTLCLLNLLAAINKYKFAAILIVAVITAITVVIVKLMPVITKFIELIPDLIKAVLNSKLTTKLLDGLGSLFKGLKTFVTGIWDWISKDMWPKIVKGVKNMGPKIKILIGFLIAAIGSAVEGDGQNTGIIATIGRLILKVLDWLIGAMPAIVDKLVVIICTLIESLATAIVNHSNRIAAALWSIVTAIVGLLVDVIDQAIRILPFGDAIANVLNLDKFSDRLQKRGQVGVARAKYMDALAARDRGEYVSQAELDELKRRWDEAQLDFDEIPILEDMINKERFDSIMQSIDLYEQLNKKKMAGVALSEKEEEAWSAALIDWQYFQANRQSFEKSQWYQDYAKTVTSSTKEINKVMGKSMAELRVLADYDQDYFEEKYQTAPEELRIWRGMLTEGRQELAEAAREEIANRESVNEQSAYMQVLQEKYNQELEKTNRLFIQMNENSPYMKVMQANSGDFAAEQLYKSLSAYDRQMDQMYYHQYAFVDKKVNGEIVHLAYKKAGDQATEYMLDTASQAVQEFVDAVSNDANTKKVTESGEGATEVWTDALINSNSKNKISNSVSNGNDGMIDLLSLDLTTGGKQAGVDGGQYTIDGYLESLTNEGNLNNIKLAGAGIFGAAEEGYNEASLTESPSRVMMKKGFFVVQGLVNGIRNNFGLAENSGGTLADKVLNAFGNPMEYISKILSGELTYDPSIRPVVDMSSVSGSALTLQDMFRNQNVQVSGLSGRLATDVGQLQRDNQDVVNELVALREDMAYMTEQMTNLQVVMDNGALVGQLAGGIDQELGRRTIRKGRGV